MIHTILCIILILMPLCLACGPSLPTSSSATSSKTSANRLGDFSLKDVDNRSHTLSEYLGKHIIVISFFAMWCEPCKKELVHLDALFKSLRDKGVLVLAISMDEPETQGEVRPYAKQRKFAFPVLLDIEGVASGLFNPRREAPYNLIINRRQSIVWSKSGYTPGDEKMIEDAVLSVLETANESDE
jgi:peroxiredoxin